MRILAIAPQPFFSTRGTPFSVYYRTLVTAEQGVKIDLLTYGSGQDVDIPGVRVIRIPRVPGTEPVPIGPSWRKLLLDALMLLWTIGLLVRHRHGVVHAHEESVFWCRFLKPLFGFSLIYDMHSSLPQQLVNFRFATSSVLIGAFRRLEDSCLRAATAVITICPDLRDYVLATGFDPNRHLLIENSIFDDVRLKASGTGRAAPANPPRVSFGPGHPVILYAGNFEAYQGIEILVQGFALTLQRRPEARLLLVGGTDERIQKIRELADSLSLGEACVLAGRVSKNQALAYTASADVLASPRTHGTNTPLKIYEQLASGKPLVATRIWSHTQVLDESVCFLADPTPDALAVAMVAALSDTAGAAERARNALALYEREYSRPIYEAKIRRLLEIVG